MSTEWCRCLVSTQALLYGPWKLVVSGTDKTLFPYLLSFFLRLRCRASWLIWLVWGMCSPNRSAIKCVWCSSSAKQRMLQMAIDHMFNDMKCLVLYLIRKTGMENGSILFHSKSRDGWNCRYLLYRSVVYALQSSWHAHVHCWCVIDRCSWRSLRNIRFLHGEVTVLMIVIIIIMF